MTANSSNAVGYQGFDNPENLYPGVGNIPNIIYTGAYQTRQFGAGDAHTIGRAHTILSGLASPPANMVTAANNGGTNAVNLYVVTQNDLEMYGPAT